jgi:predicted  nucleic acid-binding Zn-ribbon protein
MTTPAHQPDAGDNNAAKPAPANDSAATGQKLLDDLGSKFYPGASKPDQVGQLVTDGVLPAGSTVIDFGAVKTHLAADQKALDGIKDQKPADNTQAGKDVTDATGKDTAAGKALDDAKAKAKPLEDQIQARKDEDAKVDKAFGVLTKAGKGDAFSKDDLTKLSTDKDPAVAAAAKDLLTEFHPAVPGHGPRGSGGKPEQDDYTEGRGFLWGTQKIDKDGIAKTEAQHAAQNTADGKTLAPLEAAKDTAQKAKDSADTDLAAKQKALDTINQGNTALDAQKTQLAQNIKDEQAALTPDGSLDKAGRVVKGGGYYQVAENLLGIDDKKGPTTEQAKELKLLTHLLQEEVKANNGGKLPPYLKQNDPLLTSDGIQDVMDKLKKSLAPPAVPPTNG